MKIDKFIQRGDSDSYGYGSIWSSTNLDLANKNKKGTLLITPRSLVNYSSTDNADLGLPVAFRYVTGVGWYAICGAKIFQNGSSGGTPNTTRSPFTTFFLTTDSGTPPTDCDINSDMELMPDNDDLYVTAASTSTYKFNGASWSTVTGAGGTSGFVKKLAYFRKRGRMYMSYGLSKILSWDASDTVASPSGTPNTVDYAMDIGASAQNYITTIIPANDFIWILTLNTAKNSSEQYLWDGFTKATPNDKVDLDSNGALSGLIKDNTLWIVDTEGRLMMHNGGSFIEKARFPFGGKTPKNSLLGSPTDSNPRWIHHNAMSLVDGKINILIGNAFQDGTEESVRCPAGVWEYDDATGSLYHKLGATYHAKTSGSVTDYGQKRVIATGALMSAKHSSTDNGDLLFGMKYYSDATTSKSSIFTNDSLNTLEKYATFVSQWIKSDNLKQSSQDLDIMIRKLLTSTDKIMVKYRENEEVSFQITGTWASTSTFYTATELTDYIGYEVEVMNGAGASKTAHITACTESGASGWLITLNDTFTGVTGTFIGVVQNFKFASVFSKQNDSVPRFVFTRTEASPRFQFKVCYQVKGDNQTFEFNLENKKHQ